MTRLLPLTLAICASGAVAEPVSLSGAIGPYAIEVELERQVDTLVGRYRYAGREAWLDLSGEAYGNDAVRLLEHVDGTETGAFYLDVTVEGYVGFWARGEQEYPVELVGASGPLLEEEFAPDVNAALTGQYEAGGYWVNDWFAPSFEIGFNGGAADVVQISQDEILVAFTFTVGPTYHIASFQGVAKRVGESTYLHNAVLSGSDQPCRLEFEFNGPELSITDEDNGYACQFGARAHANFDLMKISNIAEFGDDW